MVSQHLGRAFEKKENSRKSIFFNHIFTGHCDQIAGVIDGAIGEGSSSTVKFEIKKLDLQFILSGILLILNIVNCKVTKSFSNKFLIRDFRI